jgi:hypothetical protein
MDGSRRQKEGEAEPPLVALARFSGHGLTLALATGFFLFLGWLLDARLGTVPLFTIVGALTGAAAGFYHLIQHLILLPRDREEREESEPKTGEQDAGPEARDGRGAE